MVWENEDKLAIDGKNFFFFLSLSQERGLPILGLDSLSETFDNTVCVWNLQWLAVR